MIDWRRLVAPALMASTVLGVLFGVQGYLVARPAAGLDVLGRTMLEQLVPMWSWGALAVVLLPLMRWMELHRLPAPHLLLCHVVFAVGASLAQSLFMAGFEAATGLYGFEGDLPGVLRWNATHRLVSGLVFYAPVAAVYHAMAYVEELRRARDTIRRSERQKVLSIRQLAGGLSHELNNALTAAINTAQLALQELEGHPAESDVRTTLDACRRLLPVTHHLQALGRELATHPVRVASDTVVRSLVRVTRERSGAAVGVRDAPGSDDEDVLVDLSWLIDIVAAMVDWARDEVRPGAWTVVDRGWVEVPDSARFLLDPSTRRLRGFVVAARPAGSVDVEDLFEPNFVGEGASVGPRFSLAAARAVMNQMHGYVSAEREQNELRFNLYLAPA